MGEILKKLQLSLQNGPQIAEIVSRSPLFAPLDTIINVQKMGTKQLTTFVTLFRCNVHW